MSQVGVYRKKVRKILSDTCIYQNQITFFRKIKIDGPVR